MYSFSTKSTIKLIVLLVINLYTIFAPDLNQEKRIYMVLDS